MIFICIIIILCKKITQKHRHIKVIQKEISSTQPHLDAVPLQVGVYLPGWHEDRLPGLQLVHAEQPRRETAGVT